MANEKTLKRLENKQKILFMEPNDLDAKHQAYYELYRDQILLSRGFVDPMLAWDANGGDAHGGGDAI